MSEISLHCCQFIERFYLKLFKKSLDSILNQSLLPNELIVIFDGPVHLNIKKYILKKKKNLNL